MNFTEKLQNVHQPPHTTITLTMYHLTIGLPTNSLSNITKKRNTQYVPRKLSHLILGKVQDLIDICPTNIQIDELRWQVELNIKLMKLKPIRTFSFFWVGHSTVSSKKFLKRLAVWHCNINWVNHLSIIINQILEFSLGPPHPPLAWLFLPLLHLIQAPPHPPTRLTLAYYFIGPRGSNSDLIMQIILRYG